ncbi:MAG: GatB/YqeY domain-containing protein [Desulfobacteraceae bacterium]|nr:GatB/YqeY domain-containing protein [Desulfobacteraceae bacterium]
MPNTLQQEINCEYKAAMKVRNKSKINDFRVIIGELSRQPDKTLPDPQVIEILKKLEKAEKEALQRLKLSEPTNFLKLVQSYLPAMASENEIRIWIQDKIDFAQFKNKMQAIKPVMKHFGNQADGNQVKQILMEI